MHDLKADRCGQCLELDRLLFKRFRFRDAVDENTETSLSPDHRIKLRRQIQSTLGGPEGNDLVLIVFLVQSINSLEGHYFKYI